MGAQAVEVEVDEETGQTRVTKLAACYDIGQAINRQSAEGQIEGGAVQGMGHAMMEEVVLDEGISKNPHLLDYKIPTTLDAPPIETILLESGAGLGPFGAFLAGRDLLGRSDAVLAEAVATADIVVTMLPSSPLAPSRAQIDPSTRLLPTSTSLVPGNW